MKRIAVLSGVITTLLLFQAPAVMAAGGGNPPVFCFSPGCTIVNPAIAATILVDTHIGTSGVPTAGQAMIFLRQGTVTTQASFNALPLAQALWVHGCDTTRTDARFLWSPSTDEATLADWVPAFTLESLFVPFGIITGPTVVPVITQIANGQGSGVCLPAPVAPTDDPSDLPGWLLMNATVQFLVPVTK